MGSLLLLQIVIYGATLWFGLYLLARSGGKPGMQFAGCGLVAYAVSVCFASLGRYSSALAQVLADWYPVLALLPALCWFGAAWSLMPSPYRSGVPARSLIVTGVVIIIVTVAGLVGGVGRWILAVTPLGLALIALRYVWYAFRGTLPRPPLKVLFTATLFFALGSGLLVLPLELVTEGLVLLAIGGDLALLGYAIARLDAYDEGTTFLPDALRSFASVGLVSALIGLQVFLVIGTSGLFTGASVVLTYTALSTVIALFTLHSSYQRLLDRLMFGSQTALTRERDTLITVADGLPLLDDALSPLVLEEAEFVRLTRRALTHTNDLGKLVSSPLTRLPVITARLRENNRPDTSLERAQTLRRLLIDHILRLKPYSDKDFDTGDEWRYYSVLYFPYVAGLKPYNVRPLADDLDDAARAALDWFQTHVPERTLYNWQTAAARLIARQLRESDSVSQFR